MITLWNLLLSSAASAALAAVIINVILKLRFAREREEEPKMK